MVKKPEPKYEYGWWPSSLDEIDDDTFTLEATGYVTVDGPWPTVLLHPGDTLTITQTVTFT